MSSIFSRSTCNDASPPHDAPESTDEYIRLGVPGSPSAGNVIPTVSAAIPQRDSKTAVSASAQRAAADGKPVEPRRPEG
jgi:hypothetical protein